SRFAVSVAAVATLVVACSTATPPRSQALPAAVAKAPTPGPAAPDPEPWRNARPEPGPISMHEYPAVETAKLPNGVSIYVVTRPAGVVTLSVVARGGASRLPVGKSGLAALTTRMMTEGTVRRSSLELAEAAEAMGTTLEDDAGRDSVRLGMTVLRDDVEKGLTLLAEVVDKPAFAPAELERVRAEWLDSIEAERQSPGRLSSLVGLRLLLGPALGAPVSGSRSDVRALSREDLVRFHAEAFVPENLAIVVVGDVTLAAVKPLAAKLFGRRKGPAHPVPMTPVTLPPAEPKQVVHWVDRPGAVQSAIFLCQPFPKRNESGFEARQLLSELFGGFFTSRLNMNLREEHAYTYGARSLDIATRDWGTFGIMTSVRTDVTAQALSESLSELRKVRDPSLGRPIAEGELSLARVDLEQSLGASLSHTAEVAGRVEELFVHDLSVTYFRQYPTILDKSDARTVAAEAQRLDPSHARIVIVGDKATAGADVAALGFTVETAAADLSD
ncbi:MAG TPA: pitrilysin family protein, partial [Polyangiaceae bacterium]